MEANIKKCSSKGHENYEAYLYCPNCKIYLCKKCETFHSNLFQNHDAYKLDEKTEEIFTGLLKLKNIMKN